jgi:flavin-dependent dehydrogenase
MAQLGYNVCLIERSVFPRSRIGESLSPGVWQQLKMLGAAHAVADAGFWPCRTSLVKWDGGAAVRRDHGAGASLLVDRGRFDALLLDCARSHGVRVMQPAVLRARAQHDNGWYLDIESADGISVLDAGFLADASGRSAVLRGRKQRSEQRTLALYGYWRGSMPDEPRIEAGLDAWYWGVPLPDGTYNAMAFVDAADFRSRRAPSLNAAYHDLIGRSDLMAACRDVQMCGPVRVADATPYLDSECIGPRSIKVGDAALAIDPLPSSGVQKAINTALTGAIVVNTLLRSRERAEAACRFYRSNLAESSDRHRRWTAQHYAIAASVNGGRFWQTRAGNAAAEPKSVVPSIDFNRASPDLLVALSPEAVLDHEPCIVGDMIALKPALSHPGLERPVAFLGGWELAGLLRPLQTGMALSALMDTWRIPTGSKRAIAKWLLDHGVLRPHHPETRPGRTA